MKQYNKKYRIKMIEIQYINGSKYYVSNFQLKQTLYIIDLFPSNTYMRRTSEIYCTRSDLRDQFEIS